MVRSGGLALFRNNTSNIIVINFYRNHVDVVLDYGRLGKCILTGFYGFHEVER